MKKKILIGMVALVIGAASFLNFGNVINSKAESNDKGIRTNRRQVTCSNPNYYKCVKTSYASNCLNGYLCPFWGRTDK